MKLFTIILILISSGFCQLSKHVEKRFVGIVSEVKVVNIIDSNIYLWVVANDDYIVKGEQYIPYIYVGDSLFVYWINYQKAGIGTQRGINIYKIEEKR